MAKQAENYLPKVRQQYEEFPYPDRNPKEERQRFIISWMARMDSVNHRCYAGQQPFRDFRVLVAGGGTGDSAIAWAEQLRGRGDSKVVYLDLSDASAAIAKRRAEIRGLDNIEWISDSILNIPALNMEPFDFIDCTGVLHHLEDPDAGLNALKSVLKPDGAMNLMVYGRYGRTAVYQVQDLMRLVNGDEENPRKQISNAKKVLESLPGHHWYNISQQVGWAYSDAKSNAGIFDLFLHTQDRSYTILEAHDWLERCGLKMVGEPGSNNVQELYLPETHITDGKLLEQIKQYPRKVQQAIGEATSTKVTMHEFYVTHKNAERRPAEITDTALVPWEGMMPLVTCAQLADLADQHKDALTLTFDKVPGKPQVKVPKGKYIPTILRQIDGERSIGEIITAVMLEPRFANNPPNETAVLAEFENLLVHMNRSNALFLRDKSIKPFPTIKDIESRVHTK
ncbi:MAG: class I SAM-dependent methyltransferase [Alphaproteobacteria bacterium]|nr:class I SAM-dependent methyltransferase [Alphaproteobacteria bacterium]